jgi:hypothetical protein
VQIDAPRITAKTNLKTVSPPAAISKHSEAFRIRPARIRPRLAESTAQLEHPID